MFAAATRAIVSAGKPVFGTPTAFAVSTEPPPRCRRPRICGSGRRTPQQGAGWPVPRGARGATLGSEMFVYYYGHGPGGVAEVGEALLDLLRNRPEIGDIAYRQAEDLRARVGPGLAGFAKAVRLEVGDPIVGPGDTLIPVSWVATGAPGLFPRLDGELVVSEVGDELTQIVFRGSYDPPLGGVGEALDRVVLHRLAEATVKRFVDGVITAVSDRIVQEAAEASGR